MPENKKIIVLCILDGWGVGDQSSCKYNAIQNAHPVFFNYLTENFPNSQVHTSGNYVGLPDGQMGNSEVGHMTIGSGRIVEQTLLRINNSIDAGYILKKEEIQGIAKSLGCTNKSCHIIALISDGGVHSHINHVIKISEFLSSNNVKIKLHIITDGRDVLPTSSISYVKKIVDLINGSENISIATISGRYFSMDRDSRFERTEKAYNSIALGQNKTFSNVNFESIFSILSKSHAKNVTDEFIEPQSANEYSGMSDGDAILCMNFRSDRMRQICDALLDQNFSEFPRTHVEFSQKITMVPYSEKISSHAAILFKKQQIKNTLSDVLYQHNMTQFRIAETEKYAHVTFFFNGGREQTYPGEERTLVNSPKVSTYDLKPEMSAHELTDILVEKILSKKFRFLLVNYANADMVGHTGNYEATLKAIKTIDDCLKKAYTAIEKVNGTMIVTADHGNAEDMMHENTHTKNTHHTTNPVPLIVASNELKNKKESTAIKLKNGTLADVAPTILELYGIKKPTSMSGHSLLNM